MSRGKVCMVVKNRLSTDARVKKEIKALLEDRWEVTVIAMPEEGTPERETGEGITILRPPIRSGNAEKLRNTVHRASGTDDLTVRAKLIRALRRNRLRRFFADLARDIPWEIRLRREALQTAADVYHANDLDTLQICGKAAARTGARLVYDSHELWLESAKYLFRTDSFRRFRLRRIEKRYVSRADAVISVTPLRAREMMRRYPETKKMEVIANSPEPLPDLPPKGRLRRDAEVPEDAVLVLYQGVLCPGRGLKRLTHVAAALREENLRFVFVGPDSWNGTLQAEVKELGLSESVKILPPVPSELLPEYTVDADVGMILFENTCLNNYYSLPNKLYEYMMAGVPVVSSNFPEMSNVLTETGAGLTVDSSSTKSIIEVLLKLARKPELLADMSAKGRHAALTEHNWDEQKRKLTSLYRTLKQ